MQRLFIYRVWKVQGLADQSLQFIHHLDERSGYTGGAQVALMVISSLKN